LTDSTVSTRALYGNHKMRYPFPTLGRSPAAWRRCSVCDRAFDDTGEYRVWISLRVATDVLPLLVNACSDACVRALPKPAAGVREAPAPSAPAEASEAPMFAEATSWEGVKTSPRLPPSIVFDGVTWVRVDEIEVLDAESERRHEFVIQDARETYRAHHRLTYPDGTEVRDKGRAHVDGYAQFRLLHLTPGRPVVVVRRTDHSRGDYELALTINGQRTGVVSCGGADRVHRWRNWPAMIAAEYVISDTLVVRQQSITAGADINMFHFWVYQPQ
jgi:hypothetical protein